MKVCLGNGPIPLDEQKILNPIERGWKMLELGNKKNKKGTYKSFLEHDVEHVSVDWNGLDGALRMDLREKQDVFCEGGKWNQYFDIITNMGTTEHVNPQGFVWHNILNALKPDGILACATPAPGNWAWHQKGGGLFPTEAFYQDLARRNGLLILKMYKGGKNPRIEIFVRMLKLVHIHNITIDKKLFYINGE